MNRFLNILFCICFSIVVITGAIKFTVEFKQLYYYDIDKLNIERLSGLSKEDIKLNYDYLIDYNTRHDDSEFEMPTIKSSKEGKIHFEEVRDIFQSVNTIFYICLIVSIVGIVINIKNKSVEFLNIISKAIIGIPIILALPIVIDFDRTFIIFHELLFDNNYWIFDPKLDPVINMLPTEFFLHAGMLILFIILISSIVLYSIYKKLKLK